MWAVKTVQQHYTPGPEILRMLDEFRQMMNACIQVGLVENVTSLKALSLKAYSQLAAYDAMSYYKLCAISGATGILRNHRRTVRHGMKQTTPYVRRLRLTTCYGFAPIALPIEAMVQEPEVGNPESRWKRVNELKPQEPTS
ncbi:MAG: hypothetical protein ACLPY5_09940 [Candidatus Bathyarchaeia archaeon]